MARKLAVLVKQDICLGEVVQKTFWTRLKTLAWRIEKSRLFQTSADFDFDLKNLRHQRSINKRITYGFVCLINPLPLSKKSLYPADEHLRQLSAYMRNRSTIPSNVQAPTKLTTFGWRPT